MQFLVDGAGLFQVGCMACILHDKQFGSQVFGQLSSDVEREHLVELSPHDENLFIWGRLVFLVVCAI